MKKGQAPASTPSIGRLLRGASPEIRKLLRIAHKQNFRVTRTSPTSNHFRILPPAGSSNRGFAYAPKTPSDHRSIPNTATDLRRIGVVIPHK